MQTSDIYSPVHTLSLPLLTNKGIQLDVKRDDLIHPFVSGNKWRKLKYIVQKANRENRNHFVTFGGAWSNHILATACLSAQIGYKSTAYIRGEKVQNPVLQLCETFGMTLKYTDRESYRDKKNIYNEFHMNDPQALFIDEGGYSHEAAQGCEEIMMELDQHYDHIFCACGTGATLAGIAKGAESYQPEALIHGVPVLKNGAFISDSVFQLYPSIKEVTLHLQYHFGGYGKTKPELIDFIKNFCSKTGILVEPVYTGKVFFAVMDLINKGYFKRGDKVLIIHTGGLTGFLGKYKLFAG